MEIIDTIKNFINNAKILIEETFSFLPSEIATILIAAIGIVIAMYVYRLVR